jgi:PAS domain S-box-containing protein
LLGLEPDETPASRSAFEALMHPEDLPRVTEVMAQAVIGNWPYQVEHRMRTRTGAYRWFRVSGKVINIDRSARVTGSMQDIHALKQAQAELSAVLALSPDGFIAFAEHGLVSYLSPAVDKLLPQLATGMLMARPLPEVLQQLDLQGSAAVALNAQALLTAPLMLPLRDGRALRLDLEQHAGGAVTQLLQLRDVSAELAADRMKTEFLSTAAHELRTPMATIFGFVELLMNRPDLSPERQRQFLGKVYKQSLAMVGITNDLLDLFRLETGERAPLADAAVDLPVWLTDELDAFEPPPDRRTPLLQLAHGMPALRTDAKLLARALGALLSNAYKFSEADTEVLLRLRSEPDWAVIEVIDQGRGMSAEELRHVGERFWRADKSGNQLGAGLGLALSKAACEHLGGHLTLSSTPGVGTTAEIRLPLRATG